MIIFLLKFMYPLCTSPMGLLSVCHFAYLDLLFPGGSTPDAWFTRYIPSNGLPDSQASFYLECPHLNSSQGRLALPFFPWHLACLCCLSPPLSLPPSLCLVNVVPHRTLVYLSVFWWATALETAVFTFSPLCMVPSTGLTARAVALPTLIK